MTDETDKQIYVFFTQRTIKGKPAEFKYEGNLLETTDTHFVILDFKTNSVFHLSKIHTNMQEVNP